jgi:hypothetical protein
MRTLVASLPVKGPSGTGATGPTSTGGEPAERAAVGPGPPATWPPGPVSPAGALGEIRGSPTTEVVAAPDGGRGTAAGALVSCVEAGGDAIPTADPARVTPSPSTRTATAATTSKNVSTAATDSSSPPRPIGAALSAEEMPDVTGDGARGVTGDGGRGVATPAGAARPTAPARSCRMRAGDTCSWTDPAVAPSGHTTTTPTSGCDDRSAATVSALISASKTTTSGWATLTRCASSSAVTA